MRVKKTIEVDICDLCSEKITIGTYNLFKCTGCDREICNGCMEEVHMGLYTSEVWCTECFESLNIYNNFESLYDEHIEKFETARLNLINKWKEACQKQFKNPQ